MKKIELGPVGLIVARNVRRTREKAGYSYAELSRTLTDLGRPIPPLGLRHIEAGNRRVDVDDLVMLALALDVAPLALLLPGGRSNNRDVTLLLGVGAKGLTRVVAREARKAFTDGDD